jgi:uncharacterized caspase-like protein
MGRFFCLTVLCLVAAAAAAQSRDRTLVVAPKQEVEGEARNALVIGNSAYVQGPLRNPVNDARAMAKALGEAGFRVTLVEDATQPAMVRAVRIFGEQIAKGGVGLFYFAGHGLQVKGRNYLVPVNADIAHEEEIEFNALDVNLVLAKMDAAKNGLNIVVLDACRNNPFQRSFRSVQAGLAQMDAPTGTFIAFATAPGSVAADGAGDNGVYTKYLLAEMHKPGVQIEQVFKNVRNGVMKETSNKQIPWESSSMRGDFAFRPGVAAGTAEAVAEALKREREAQRVEMEKMLAAALEQQRRQLEAAGLKPAASAPSAEITFWDSIKSSKDAADFRAYLQQYPGGQFAALAKNRLAALDKTTGTVTASLAPTPAAAASASPLPQQGDTWTYRLTERDRFGSPRASRNYTVKVAAASEAGIMENYAIESGASGSWTHAAGSYLVAVGPSIYSPYLTAFQDVEPGGSLETGISDIACTGVYRCSASAKVVGRETIKVPAGTFQALKILVDHQWWPTGGTGSSYAQREGGRKLTVWYAPAVKRAVKFSSQLETGEQPPLEANFDLELVSYQLK